ncbi:MAG: hypothetical protein ACYDCL_02055 [Myxococcales bacterium]
MATRRLVPLAACLLAAAPALAHRQAGLECEPPPFPPSGTANVPTNALIFDFAAPVLNPAGPSSVPTLPAPPPWDFDARYRVPAAPLSPNTAYVLLYQTSSGPTIGTFTTGPGPDVLAPSAPVALGHYPAPDPNAYTFCLADRLELLPIVPSIDDQTPQALLRYQVAEPSPDGGSEIVFNDLTPVELPDGGQALALPMGLSGLPDGYTVQARDLAGNLSAPSAVQAIDVGPTCDFAESTAGRGPPSLLGLWLLGLFWLRRRKR